MSAISIPTHSYRSFLQQRKRRRRHDAELIYLNRRLTELNKKLYELKMKIIKKHGL